METKKYINEERVKQTNIVIIYTKFSQDKFKNIFNFLKEEQGISFTHNNARIFITYRSITSYILYKEDSDE